MLPEVRGNPYDARSRAVASATCADPPERTPA
jgi:hypothetical protein